MQYLHETGLSLVYSVVIYELTKLCHWILNPGFHRKRTGPTSTKKSVLLASVDYIFVFSPTSSQAQIVRGLAGERAKRNSFCPLSSVLIVDGNEIYFIYKSPFNYCPLPTLSRYKPGLTVHSTIIVYVTFLARWCRKNRLRTYVVYNIVVTLWRCGRSKRKS